MLSKWSTQLPDWTITLFQVSNLFATLAKGKVFSKIDLSCAYQCLPFTEESKKFIGVNTHSRLFHYIRLNYGSSSVPPIFQSYGDYSGGHLKGSCISR